MRDWHAFVRRRLEESGLSPRLHADAIDELAAHLTDVHREALAGGATPEAAEAAAEGELDTPGRLTLALDSRAFRAVKTHQAQRRLIAGLAFDLKHAARLVASQAGTSALVVAMLALGIGIATTVFGLYSAALLRTLPYPDASRLMLLWEGARNDPDETYIVAAPVYEDWRERNRTLESLGIWEFVTFNLHAAADPARIAGVRASASLFATMGVAPALGRTFTEDEARRGARVAVISDGVWRSQFAADPTAIHRQVRLNDSEYDVIGVMPREFAFPRRNTGIYVPLTYSEVDRSREAHSFFVVARAREHVSDAQVYADIARIGDELAREHAAHREEASRVQRLDAFGMSTMRRLLTVLAGASAFVLLIGCVNVANLLIARAIDRRREFTTRRVLGAGTWRLARQLLFEGGTLAALGAAGGLAFAWIGTRTLDVVLGDEFLTFWFRDTVDVRLDGSALLFATGVAAGTALLFSLAPLTALRRTAPAAADGSRSISKSAHGLRRILVAAEVALAIVVLCGAGLLVKSLALLLAVDPGFKSDGVLAMEVALPQRDTYGPAVRRTFCEDFAAAAQNAFESTGAISHLPLTGANAGRGLSIEGRPHDPERPVNANYRLVCPGYFATMSIPFVRGRDVSVSDREPVVVINRSMAERYWQDHDPVGQRVRIGRTDDNPWMRIVGVVEDVHHFGLESPPLREIYVPYRQNAWPVMTMVARTAGPSTSASAALREALRRVDPSLPAASLQTMTQIVDGSIRWRQSYLRLLVAFALFGLALAAIGVYGVLAYFVSQRRREIGIRSALGAERRSIVSLVLRQSLVPIAGGVAIGSVVSIWSGRLLVDLLFRTEPGDPLVIGSIVALVFAVGFVASWTPARRAATVDPTIVLRGD